MKKILILSTGGTFNKYYDKIEGELLVDGNASAVKSIAEHWLCELDTDSVIGKDSLEMDDSDRKVLLERVLSYSDKKIVIVHGTDTMKETARYLDKHARGILIVLTGSMIPYSIDPVEASANLASAYGFALACEKNGIYIAMNGIVEKWDKMQKDKKAGRFVIAKS